MWVIWNLVLVRLDMELVSVQDRCMVCVKRTMVCVKRSIGLEMVLDAPNGTPR
jgi:hypothetical protein